MQQIVREVWKYRGLSHRPLTHGKVKNTMGSEYEGDLLDGQPSGFGVCMYSSSHNPIFQRYEGWWKDGRRHGQGALYLRGSEEIPIQGTWKNGHPLSLAGIGGGTLPFFAFLLNATRFLFLFFPSLVRDGILMTEEVQKDCKPIGKH